MQLKYVKIAGYKNLTDATLTFLEHQTPIAIIGNNGTGKSNLIEALLHIFIGAYYNNPPKFDFQIRYTANNKAIEIINRVNQGDYLIKVDNNEWSRAYFKKRIHETDAMPPFPTQIFTYYSGTCERVKNLIQKYNASYQRKLKKLTKELTRTFVFSDIDQAEWIVLGLIAHRHTFLLHELGIRKFDILKIKLRAPESYNPEVDDPSYWGTTGAAREFLADLDNAATSVSQSARLSIGMVRQDWREYTLEPVQLEGVGDNLAKRGTNFYSMLKVLATSDILVGSTFNIIHRDNKSSFATDSLSEGEKQLLCVIGGLTLSQDNECLVLLDEPDTHLNPAWSWRYHSLLSHALDENQRATSTTLIATHDPILISGLSKEQVFIARYGDKGLVYERPYRDPRGQGVANVLTSEFFGLPSSLDENTQDLLDERLRIAYKKRALTNKEREKLKAINSSLKDLGLGISFRDPEYKAFEESRHGGGSQ